MSRVQRANQRPCADVSVLRRAVHREGNLGRAHCEEVSVTMENDSI